MTLTVDGTTVVAPGYRLEVHPAQPRAVLRDAEGRVWTELSLLASLDLVGGRDESYDIAPVRVVAAADDAVELVIEASSSVWERKAVHVRCTDGAIEVWATVSGTGRLADVSLLGGRAVLASGAAGTFRSAIRFASLFSPTPTEPVSVVRPATAASSLGVVGDAEPGRLHGIFSPPPLCWALGSRLADGPADVPAGEWWGMSVRAPVDELTMTAVRYDPLDGGFLLRLDYEGHTAVDGSFRTPTLVLRPADTPWQALADHRADLAGHGLAPSDPPPGAAWWAEPIFCGWGAQCARAAAAAVPVAAADLARQDVYDELLGVLHEAGVDPGTVVIDDRWQASYGTGAVDRDHWPDLRGWIAKQHASGRRVLLWWKAWDPAGLPADECVTDPAGRAVAVDVANPAYLARLTRIVTELIGPDGLDADGFKVDFTQRAPSGESLRATDGPWGIAALHRLLATMSAAAKAAKPDALVVTHTPHPSFGDVTDMVRLNDVLERDTSGEPVAVVDQLRFRHAVVSASLPGHLIDTDQWPMPSREQWRAYVEAQASLGPGSVPALYYAESIDNSGEELTADDLALVALTWARYRS
ncbi:hypothetical protein [Jiangella mangrovi]|uniref:Glycoside hydrolase n=1 Tax=Jiangella mangrovi TaxID=1524084 RepID=A0A7W9GNT9_9ACTN|nr:hypothetical protein [Jiangella mangrovi]MBB5787293.1 hypothetical protein [Jiangella mangrovi]